VGFLTAFAALHYGEFNVWQAIFLGWLAGLIFDIFIYRFLF